jgi:hypothetical protein
VLKEAIVPKQPKFDHRIHQLQGSAGLSQKQLEGLPEIAHCAANHQKKVDIQPSALMLNVDQYLAQRFSRLFLSLSYRSGVRSN